MKEKLEISYRLSVCDSLFRIIVGAAMAAAAGYVAATNDRGLSIFHLVTLPSGWTNIFLWGGVGFFGFFSAILLVELVLGGAARTYHIRLTPAEFTAPKGFVMKKPLTVPLADIRKLRLEKAGFSQYLQIKTGQGTITINRSDIGQAAFNDLGVALAGRLRALGIPY